MDVSAKIVLVKPLKLFFAASLICASSLALTQTFSFKRHYKLGHSVTYKMHMIMKGKMPMDMVSKIRSVVVKVYRDGTADLKTTDIGGTMTMNGSKMAIPGTGAPMMSHVNQYGIPVKSDAFKQFPFMSSFLVFGKSMTGDMYVGQHKKINVMNPKTHTKEVWGTLTLNAIKGGIGYFSMNISMVMDNLSMIGNSTSKMTVHSVGTMELDAKTKDIIKEEGDATIEAESSSPMNGIKVHVEMRKI